MELSLEMLKKVKDEIFPTIVDMVNPEIEKDLGINKEAYAEIVYTHIMALRYNNGDINSAINDLMPYRSPIIYHWTEEEDAINMMNNLIMIMKDYQFQYWAFKGFHENIKNKMPFDKAIIEVQKALLPLQMGNLF